MCSIKPLVLPRLWRIASAQSVKEYQQAVSDLKESDEWKADTSEKFQNYVSKAWLPIYRVSHALRTKLKCKIRRLISNKTANLPFWKCSLKYLSFKEKYNC